MDQIIDDFNNTFLFMVKDLANVCPNSILGSSITDIEKFIIKPKNRKLFINIFVTKILKYKDQLQKREEGFFLDKSYDNDVDSDSFLIRKVMEIKSIWVTLKSENKAVVFDYMNMLCDLAQQYFLMNCN